MKRNIAIDVAKGIGILFVVWGHTSKACPIHNEIYLFHMPLFFLLSGYFFKLPHSTFLQVLQKKIQAYIFPYFFFMFLCLSLAAILYTVTGELHKFPIKPETIINPGGVVTALWFLPCLFEVQLIYYAIERFIRKDIFRLVCCLMLLFIGYLLSVEKIHFPLFLDSSLSMVLFFFIGKILNKRHMLNTPVLQQLPILIIGAGFYVVAILLDCRLDVKVNLMKGDPILLMGAALGASYIIVYLSYSIAHLDNILRYLANIFSYLGRNTMIIFTLHILGFEITRHLLHLPSGAKATSFQGLYYVFFGVVLSLVIGYPLKYVLPYLKFPGFLKKEKTRS